VDLFFIPSDNAHQTSCFDSGLKGAGRYPKFVLVLFCELLGNASSTKVMKD